MSNNLPCEDISASVQQLKTELVGHSLTNEPHRCKDFYLKFLSHFSFLSQKVSLLVTPAWMREQDFTTNGYLP